MFYLHEVLRLILITEILLTKKQKHVVVVNDNVTAILTYQIELMISLDIVPFDDNTPLWMLISRKKSHNLM